MAAARAKTEPKTPAGRARHAKPDTAQVHRRVFRVAAGLTCGDGTQVVIAEALALGLRPVGNPYIESDELVGDHQVTVWAVEIENGA